MVDFPASLVMEDNFQTCDSPSGSSTSEPHDETHNTTQPLSFMDQSFFHKLSQLTSDNPLFFMQPQSNNNTISPVTTTISTSPNTVFTSAFVDPLSPNNNNNKNEPTSSSSNFWPDFNHAIPDLAKNYTNHITGYSFNSRSPQMDTHQNKPLPGMQIRVLGVPQTGAKSRVETQIKLCIQLVTDDGDKAQQWSHLKLPEHMVAKEKLKRQILLSTAPNGSKVASIAGLDNSTVHPEKMLYLSARVICASDPSRKVVTCLGCIQRERKRSQRRKENKKVDSEEQQKLDDEKSIANEEQKILLFNCSEVVDFSSGDTILPTRITCYCRHHNERVGFCIYFEINDHTGKQVATGISPPIMITDDHKSNKLKSGRKRPRTDMDSSSSHFTTSSFDSRHIGSTSSTPSVLPRQFHNHYQIQPRPSPELTKINEVSSFLSPEVLGTPPERPLLQRLIPNEGPTYGGIEVTLLGSGFRSGLTCMFGDVAASSTHYWSPNTLVCILPPAADVGTVVVSFKEYPLVMDSQDVMLFTYYNENDRALMELALQVVGLKMTGKVENAREIAMRIVQGGANNNDSQTQNNTTTHGNQPQQTNLERHIMQVLEVMTTFRDVDPADVSITSAQGHTMLHFAAMLGFAQLSEMLIRLGCNTNITDKNGYTALHYAAWHNHQNVTAVLLEKGSADPEISNRWNKKPLQLTDDPTIRYMLWNHTPADDDYYSSDSEYGYDSSDMLSADIDTSFDEDDEEASVWLSDADVAEDEAKNVNWEQYSYLSDSDDSLDEQHEQPYLVTASYGDGLRNRKRRITQQPFIQYLKEIETASHSPEEIMDAEPLHDVDPPTDYEDEKIVPKEMSWMQRTLSHFQPAAPNDLLQNIKNNIPAKPTDLNLKNIADHILQFPSRPASMMSGLFSNNKTHQQEEPEQTLAWYMALAYAMGAGSLVTEDDKEDNHSVASSTTNQEEYAVAVSKRRDRRLYSFWVPMLCLMIIWLIFQFVSSHPGLMDTIIGIAGFRRQYLTIH
ncbi:hypothetical protein RMCBS344292_02068 [Rhizopus microsporus]|nr:hypothetical protein RMCBS344292_02068 [Rhizopus microsporus]